MFHSKSPPFYLSDDNHANTVPNCFFFFLFSNKLQLQQERYNFLVVADKTES